MISQIKYAGADAVIFKSSNQPDNWSIRFPTKTSQRLNEFHSKCKIDNKLNHISEFSMLIKEEMTLLLLIGMYGKKLEANIQEKGAAALINELNRKEVKDMDKKKISYTLNDETIEFLRDMKKYGLKQNQTIDLLVSLYGEELIERVSGSRFKTVDFECEVKKIIKDYMQNGD